MKNEPVAWMDYKGYLLDSDDVENYQKEGLICIPLYTHPAKTPAKQKYDDCMKDCDEPNPVERLRFFLSCALTGQDWLDVEPFIDAITHPAKTLTDDEIEEVGRETLSYWDSYDEGLVLFAKAILRKAQEK